MRADQSPVRDDHSLRSSLELLVSRRFGTFWFASLLSSIGTWTQAIAEPWLLLGLVGALVLLAMPLAIDRQHISTVAAVIYALVLVMIGLVQEQVVADRSPSEDRVAGAERRGGR